MRVVVLNLALNCTLIWTPLREAGLAWSTAICATLQVAMLLHGMRGRAEAARRSVVAGSALRVVTLTALMVIAVMVVQSLLPPPDGWAGWLLQLVIEVAVGIIVYAGGAVALRMQEIRWSVGR
jgi:peptidoglycan biosynthesis protein MviN/MurJ (putative lipid II flippase)